MKNLKIEIHLSNATIVPAMPFDSILARLYFDKQKEEGVFTGDYDQELPFLKKTHGIYHTSMPIYAIRAIENISITKRFDTQLYEFFGGQSIKAMYEAQSGPFKAWFESFEAIITDKVTYYVCGDDNTVIDLLGRLRYLGKKTSIGLGKIKKILISEENNDYSILDKDNNLMRHVPDIPEFANIANSGKVMFPLSPPYWKNEEATVCVAPLSTRMENE